MKLITLNTWGKCGPFRKRWDYFLKELERFSPDILCLQEVVNDELPKKIQHSFALNHIHSSYIAGLAIISRFPLLETDTLTYQTCSPLETDYERKVIFTKIKINDRNLVIANTHLAWREEDHPTREGQVKELLEVLKKLKDPSMITGDLNDVPESSPLVKVKTVGYKNLIEDFIPVNQKAVTWDNQNLFIQTHNVRFPDRQIDYILIHPSVSKILKPISCKVIFNRMNEKQIYPSDHYGIFAEFEIVV